MTYSQTLIEIGFGVLWGIKMIYQLYLIGKYS